MSIALGYHDLPCIKPEATKKQFSVGLRRRDPSLQPSGRLPGVMIYPSSCGTGTWPKHVCCFLCSYFSSHFLPCSHHPLPRRGSATQGRPAEGLQAAGRWQAPGALGWALGPRPLPFWALPPQAPALCCNTCFKPCLLSKNPSPTPRCQPWDVISHF